MTAFASEVIELADDIETFNAYALEQGWSDGLPLIPPTEARVERMLAQYLPTAAEVVAQLPVENADCTVEKIAINSTSTVPMAALAPAGKPMPRSVERCGCC